MPSNPRLVLASTSPYRAALLQRLGLPFEQHGPDVDEARADGETADGYVARLAAGKAGAVARDDALVIGADQAAVLDGEVLGKPGGYQRAEEQLTAASGRRVTFLTGLCLRDTISGRQHIDVVPFHVTFRELDADTIRRYVAQDQPLDCAGSFRAEGLGITLFRRMEGDDPTALVGLPLIRLVDFLLEAGVRIP